MKIKQQKRLSYRCPTTDADTDGSPGVPHDAFEEDCADSLSADSPDVDLENGATIVASLTRKPIIEADHGEYADAAILSAATSGTTWSNLK